MSFHYKSLIFAAFLGTASLTLAADQPQAPQKSKDAPAAAPNKSAPESKPTSAASQSTPQAGGLTVFIDPATGKIRQPEASEIGALNASSTVTTQRTEAVTFQGPGTAIGVKLGPESMSYMVVTKTPDGKLVEDCVTGDQAAKAIVAPGATPKPVSTVKPKGALDDK